MIGLRTLACAATAWFLAGAASGVAQTCIVVSATTTDPQITSFTNVHTACIDLSNPRRGKLFVFLPGTGGIPAAYQQIVKTAALSGYHAIGLMYVNPTSIVELCAFSPDADCNRNARLEVITGTNLSGVVSVNQANSIDNRLAKMLVHLHGRFPGLQWNRFYDAQTNIVWSNVVVAGHSQGGGHAMMIAKTRPVDRCLMFAAMDWRFLPSEGVPNWVGEPGVTAPDRYFGLGHHEDPTVVSNRIVANWIALGLDQFAPEHLVDGASAPYGASHMLMTDLPSSNAHSCMISDLAMITNGNGSVYGPVWHWMLNGPTELPVLAISNDLTVTFEVKSEWRYQLKATTNHAVFSPAGAIISGSNGMVTATITNQGFGFYRVDVGY